MLSHYLFPYHSDCTNQPLLSPEIGEMYDMTAFHFTVSAVETASQLI